MYKTEISTRDHFLTITEVQEMASVGNLEEQVILEVLLLGLRVSDACTVEWKLFDVLEQEAPIPLILRTRKEGINAYTYISEEFRELLRKYFPLIDKKNLYLLQSARLGHMDEDSLNWTLKNLAKRANINVRGNLHWHCGRKLFLRTCAENGINMWNAKLMCGKSIPKDIETYINGIQLKEDFTKISNILRLRKANGRISNAEAIVNKILEVQARMIKEQLKKEGVMMFKPNEELTPLEIIERYLASIEKEKEEKMA